MNFYKHTIFIIVFIFKFILPDALYADDFDNHSGKFNFYKTQQKHPLVNISSGGQMNFTFGKIAGPRSGNSYISGYTWLSTYHPISDGFYLSGNAGLSLERSASNTIIFNDASIGIHLKDKNHIFIGRTLNAAGRLHHDISDFGAPGGGIDNHPISDFNEGNFSTNVAQKLTLPFTQRIAYYIKPYKEFIALGLSYTPHIGTYHPANYRFFADTSVKNEISTAISSEMTYEKYFLGVTSGFTTATRDYSRFYPQDRVSAQQFSIQFQKTNSVKKNKAYLLELNYGCLKDSLLEDCRQGFQFSRIAGKITRSSGIQTRKISNTLTTDYDIGFAYQIGKGISIGGETIYRVKNSENKTQSDFNWLAGMSVKF